MTSGHDPVLSNLSQDYGRLVYTHKAHEKEAERKARQSLCLTWVNLIVVTVTLASTLAMPLLKETWAQWIPVVSAALAFGFGTAQLSFQPQRESIEHRSAAKAFLNLRDEFARLIADGQVSPDAPDLRPRRDVLVARLAELYAYAPQTSSAAYKKARNALTGNEELIFSEEELDRMLPKELRGRE